jgi:uncharacterized protein
MALPMRSNRAGWRVAAATLLATSVVLVVVPEASARRLEAAVIGNSDYAAAPLANAARDAAAVAEALAEAGFAVRTYFDVPRADMDRILTEIGDQFDSADISVLYYAGHAFQYNGQNQLLAADVPALTADQIEAKRVALTDVLQRTAPSGEGAAERLRLVIIDACRNDPFSTVDAAFQRGLSFEESGDTQTLIAYSTSAGQLAYDGPSGGNGPYALAFARAIRDGDATVSSVLRSVRRDVRLATDGLQIPWVVGSSETDPLVGTGTEAQAVAFVQDGVPQLDEIVWTFVRRDLTTDTLSQFVANFPSSSFVEDANRRMREIEVSRADTTRQLVLVEGEVTGATLNELAEARARAEDRPAYEPETDIPAELFALWPETLPEVERGLAQIVTRCDLLAADPSDPQRLAPPVRDGLVNVREAARACGFALAADSENPRLLHQFGRVLQLAARHDWARAYYTRASAQKYSASLTNLGYMAIQGIGQDKDLAAAESYYRQAAALGNLRARTNIGTMYVKGEGLPELPEEGVLWYRLASGMGWANAQNALADLYRKGIGVPKDERAAAALFRIAAENGQREAMNSLGRSYLAGWGVEPDRETAHLWFERAIEAGDRFAPRFYAVDLMSDGDANAARVLDLLQLSADRGFAQAYGDLAKVYLDGSMAPADPRLAFLNARIAELREVEGAADLVARSKARLSEADIRAIEVEIDQRRRLNGL